jgi:hypothetical protein
MLRASSLSAARGRPDSWKRFAVAFAALVGAFLLLPDGSWPQSAAFGVIGVGVAVAGARTCFAAPVGRHASIPPDWTGLAPTEPYPEPAVGSSNCRGLWR